MTDIRHWKEFEKLIAAIQRCAHDGARVNWNEKIDGRQFDCVIRFPYGLYSYLVVLECRNKSNRTPADEIDSFVTKSRDAKVDKAIFVSKAGYQSGALAVAERHGIDLYTIDEVDELPEDAIDFGLMPVIKISEFKIYSPSKKILRTFPDRPNRLRFWLTNSKFYKHKRWVTFAELVNECLPRIQAAATATVQDYTIQFSSKKPAKVPLEHNPVKDESVRAKYVSFQFQVVEARTFQTHHDPDHVQKSINFRSVVTGDSRLFTRKEISKGLETELRAGVYYRNVVLDGAYYCESVNGDIATMHMIESYQHGRFLQATFTIDIDQGSSFLEIEDTAELDHLKIIHEEYKS
ncbi:MAG: restriction endonuclease [Pseudomonadota bacterium]